jgi:hypothetical protein
MGLIEVGRAMAEQTSCKADVIGGVCSVGAVGNLDRKAFLMSTEYREKLRVEEIKKLADFGNSEQFQFVML